MFAPHSVGSALLMMIASAICWGSWANTYKGVKSYRFELFYWDYAIGIFLISLVLAFTMGSSTQDASSFPNNVHAADTANFYYTLVGGDRKSTRLNSSHGYISYAVFCLKKNDSTVAGTVSTTSAAASAA